jgi:hypothetical protein
MEVTNPGAAASETKGWFCMTPRWREMDSNFRFRASGDTHQRLRGEAADRIIPEAGPEVRRLSAGGSRIRTARPT